MRETRATRLVVVRPAHDLQQFMDAGQVACLGGIDGLLGQVVAQHVAGIGQPHAFAAHSGIERVLVAAAGVCGQPVAQRRRDGLALGRIVEGVVEGRQRRVHRIRVDQRTEEQRHVDLALCQQLLQRVHPFHVLIPAVGQPQLACDIVAIGPRVSVSEALQSFLQRLHSVEQRRQGLREAAQVPSRHPRLPAEAIAATLGVGGVRRPVRVVVVDPSVGAVVDGQAEHRHVVGVHHAMHETHAHPVRHHHRRAFADLGEPRGVQRLAFPRQVRKIAPDREVHQCAQQVRVAPRGRQLVVAEAQERRCHAAHDRARFGFRMAVVEHVAHDRLAGTHQTQGPRGRYAQMVHRLAAQELADRGAQHRAPIGGARVRRRAGTLQLQFPALTAPVDRFAQCDGAAVAELSGPVAELVATVIARVRLHALQQRVAAEHLREGGRRDIGVVEAEQRRDFTRVRQQRRRSDGRGRGRRPQRTTNLPTPMALLRISRQFANEAVVEAQGVQAAHAASTAWSTSGVRSGRSATRSSNTKQAPS